MDNVEFVLIDSIDNPQYSKYPLIPYSVYNHYGYWRIYYIFGRNSKIRQGIKG